MFQNRDLLLCAYFILKTSLSKADHKIAFILLFILKMVLTPNEIRYLFWKYLKGKVTQYSA